MFAASVPLADANQIPTFQLYISNQVLKADKKEKINPGFKITKTGREDLARDTDQRQKLLFTEEKRVADWLYLLSCLLS